MLMRENPLELIKRLFRYQDGIPTKIITTIRNSIISRVIEKKVNRNTLDSTLKLFISTR